MTGARSHEIGESSLFESPTELEDIAVFAEEIVQGLFVSESRDEWIEQRRLLAAGNMAFSGNSYLAIFIDATEGEVRILFWKIPDQMAQTDVSLLIEIAMKNLAEKDVGFQDAGWLSIRVVDLDREVVEERLELMTAMARRGPGKTNFWSPVSIAERAIVELYANLQKVKAPSEEEHRRMLLMEKQTARDIVQAMYEKSWVDASRRKPAEDIIRVVSSNLDSDNQKPLMAEMVRAGILESKEGRGGGYWLTQIGITEAKKQKFTV